MTDLDHEAARIAKSLTKAQRASLERLAQSYAWADRRSVKALVRRGLAYTAECHAFSDTATDWLSAPTPLGLRVRSILSQVGDV